MTDEKSWHAKLDVAGLNVPTHLASWGAKMTWPDGMAVAPPKNFELEMDFPVMADEMSMHAKSFVVS